MKILFFIDSLRSGGKERRLVELIKGLSEHPEFELEIVLTKDIIHYKGILSTNIKIHYTIRKNIKKDPRIFYQFYKIARIFKPDIIHVWSNLVAIYAIPTKLIFRVPMINNQITNSTLQKSNTVLSHKLTFPFSDKIISNTYAGLRAYNAPFSKSCVIYNGFDFNRIYNLDDKSSIQAKFKIQTKNVIGMVASFTEKKDYQTFIEAANIVLKKNRDITFLCIGSGDSSRFELMVKLKNKNNILFLGKQTNVESIMNVCDIGVLLTHGNHGEGISNAILEFSALGKPVIATLGDGTSEIVKNNFSGYLIKKHSSKELIDKIIYLLGNDNVSKNFGENAKIIVNEKFNIIKMIDEFRNVYKEIVA